MFGHSRQAIFFILLLAAFFVAENSFALPSFKKSSKESLPAILKADEVDGDQIANTITARGNVEVSKGTSVVYADKVIYKKNGGIVSAIGNVKIKNIEIANVTATKANIKDDFSSGDFFETTMVFNDGSYLSSPKISRKNPLLTVLDKSIFSICPNPEISADNDLAGKDRDFVSIKSRETSIDRKKNVMRSKGVALRFYDVPVFYTPYLSVALPSKKKKSGFLTPKYAKSTNLGLGVRLPYYFFIAPNMDLTTTPLISINDKHLLVNNEFRHKATYGEYDLNLELANNKITSYDDKTVVNRTDAKYRWNMTGSGNFDFTQNVGVDFKSNIVSDRNYLRDYHFNYLNYSLSKVNLDYIHGRTYHAVKLIKIQELETEEVESAEPTIMPQIDSHIETKPLFFKEKFALTSNMTVITRKDGLQYRRATAVPEVNVPFNLGGNLFGFNGKVQNDFYYLEDNSSSTATDTDYNSTQTNLKPEASFNWKLPLIKKTDKSTLLIEPMVNAVASSYKKTFNALPNEDSNEAELSVSNLFISDRIAGFDRNESGKRVSYGVKSSLFNHYGHFELTVGQVYKKSGNTQDAEIKGFGSSNKSNLVGQAMYEANKYFSLNYLFQLHEVNYRNDINQVSATLSFDRISFGTSYLLIRKSEQNLREREQASVSSAIKLVKDWSVKVAANQDLVLERTLSRSLTLARDGCCTTFAFSAIETNPSNLIKSQKSFNISLIFKNL